MGTSFRVIDIIDAMRALYESDYPTNKMPRDPVDALDYLLRNGPKSWQSDQSENSGPYDPSLEHDPSYLTEQTDPEDDNLQDVIDTAVPDLTGKDDETILAEAAYQLARLGPVGRPLDTSLTVQLNVDLPRNWFAKYATKKGLDAKPLTRIAKGDRQPSSPEAPALPPDVSLLLHSFASLPAEAQQILEEILSTPQHEPEKTAAKLDGLVEALLNADINSSRPSSLAKAFSTPQVEAQQGSDLVWAEVERVTGLLKKIAMHPDWQVRYFAVALVCGLLRLGQDLDWRPSFQTLFSLKTFDYLEKRTGKEKSAHVLIKMLDLAGLMLSPSAETIAGIIKTIWSETSETSPSRIAALQALTQGLPFWRANGFKSSRLFEQTGLAEKTVALIKTLEAQLTAKPPAHQVAIGRALAQVHETIEVLFYATPRNVRPLWYEWALNGEASVSPAMLAIAAQIIKDDWWKTADDSQNVWDATRALVLEGFLAVEAPAQVPASIFLVLKDVEDLGEQVLDALRSQYGERLDGQISLEESLAEDYRLLCLWNNLSPRTVPTWLVKSFLNKLPTSRGSLADTGFFAFMIGNLLSQQSDNSMLKAVWKDLDALPRFFSFNTSYASVRTWHMLDDQFDRLRHGTYPKGDMMKALEALENDGAKPVSLRLVSPHADGKIEQKPKSPSLGDPTLTDEEFMAGLLRCIQHICRLAATDQNFESIVFNDKYGLDLLGNSRWTTTDLPEPVEEKKVWHKGDPLRPMDLYFNLLRATLLIGGRLVRKAGSAYVRSFWKDNMALKPFAEQLHEVFATAHGAIYGLDPELSRHLMKDRADWIKLARQLAFFLTPAHADFVKPGAATANFPSSIYGKDFSFAASTFGPYAPDTFDEKLGFIELLKDDADQTTLAKPLLGHLDGPMPLLEFERALFAVFFFETWGPDRDAINQAKQAIEAKWYLALSTSPESSTNSGIGFPVAFPIPTTTGPKLKMATISKHTALPTKASQSLITPSPTELLGSKRPRLPLPTGMTGPLVPVVTVPQATKPAVTRRPSDTTTQHALTQQRRTVVQPLPRGKTHSSAYRFGPARLIPRG